MARFGLALALVSAALAATAPCAAQVEVTPFVGVYWPPVDPSIHPDVVCIPGPCGFSGPTQGDSPAVGTRLTIRVGAQLAYDISVSYAWTHVTVPTVPNPGFGVYLGPTDAHTATGSIGFLLFGSPRVSRPCLYFGGGLSLVALGGGSHDAGIFGAAQTDWGAHATIGARLPVARTVAMRFEVDDVGYAFKDSDTSKRSLQNGVMVSVGLSMVVRGRSASPH